ncbi:hypothetical protein Gotur_024811 [Gossypium turneri]
MGWLRDTFPEPDDDSTELERIRYARAYIFEIPSTDGVLCRGCVFYTATKHRRFRVL